MTRPIREVFTIGLWVASAVNVTIYVVKAYSKTYKPLPLKEYGGN